MPYICVIRDDIPEGTLQILDLKPYTTQTGYAQEPVGQSKYVNRVVNDTVATSGANPVTTAAEYKGLAAYLLDRVENTSTGAALTAAQANGIAEAIIARMDDGGSLTLSDINALINAEQGVSGSDLDGTLGNSTGSVRDVLKILAGGEYVLPAGVVLESGGAFNATISGSFTAGQYRETYNTGSLRISWNEGALATCRSSSFSYKGVSGAAVVVYDDDGSLYTG